MRSKKSFFVLIIALVVIVGAYLLVDTFVEKEDTRPIPLDDKIGTADTLTPLVTIDRTSVKSISYTSLDMKHTFTMEDGIWIYEEHRDYPLYQAYINNLLTAVSNINYTRMFTDNAEITEYANFDEPLCDIGVTYTDGSTAHYKIGTLNPTTKTYYFQIEGDPAVYMVKEDAMAAFFKTIYELSIPEELPQIGTNELTALEIIKPGSNLKFSKVEPEDGDFYTDTILWKSVENGVIRPADGTAVLIFTNDLFTVVLRNLVGYTDFESTKLEDFGLDEPSCIYRVHTADGPVMGLVMGDTTDEGRIYFMLEGSKFIYECTTTFAEKLVNDDVLDFLPASVCSIGLDEIIYADVTIEGETHTLTVENGGDEATYRVDGTEVPHIPVANFIIEMTAMIAADTIEDSSAYQDEPYLTIDFVRNTDKFSNMTLKFIPYDINYYLVEFNGMRNILVTKRDVEELAATFKVLLDL